MLGWKHKRCHSSGVLRHFSAHLHGFTSFSVASQHTGQQAPQLCCILRGSLAQLGHCLEALGGQLGNGLGCHVGQHHQAGLIPPAPLHHKEGGWVLLDTSAVPEPTGTQAFSEPIMKGMQR